MTGWIELLDDKLPCQRLSLVFYWLILVHKMFLLV